MKKLLLLITSLLLCFSLSSCSLLTLAGLGNIAKNVDTEDISTYGDFRETDLLSEFLIFPERIPESAENIKYRYKYEMGFVDPCGIVYLEYNLSEEEYNAEIERLENIQGFGYGHLPDNINFTYPAIVTMADREMRHEYVLKDSENLRLIYVSLQGYYEKNSIGINDEYLPDYFEECSSKDFYNSYAYSETDAFHVISHASHFEKAEESEGEIKYYCTVALRNSYYEGKSVRLSADFSEEEKAGFITEGSLAGYSEDGNDTFKVDGRGCETFTVVFKAKRNPEYDGTALKSDRNLPEITVEVVED